VKYPVAKWIRLVRPLIEEKLGPLPPFSIRAYLPPPGWRRGIPWEFDRNERGITFLYYPKRIRVHLQREESGYLAYVLIHHLIHLYQEPHFIVPLSEMSEKQPCKQWVEGSVDLAAWSILAPLVASLDRDDALIAQMFGESAQGDPEETIEGFTAHFFASLAKSLHRRGMLTHPTVAALELPFSLPIATDARIQELIVGQQKLRMQWTGRNIAYALGHARCARIVSSGIMTIDQLLRTPMTDRKLRQLAGI